MLKRLTDQHLKVGPDYEKMVAAGREVGRQIREKQGPAYEKWRESMKRVAEDM